MLVIFGLIWYFLDKSKKEKEKVASEKPTTQTPTTQKPTTQTPTAQSSYLNDPFSNLKKSFNFDYNPIKNNNNYSNYKPTMSPKNIIMGKTDFDNFSKPQSMYYNNISSNTSPIIKTEQSLLDMARHQPPHPTSNFSSPLQKSGNYLMGDLKIIPRLDGIYQPLESSPNDINRGYFREKN